MLRVTEDVLEVRRWAEGHGGRPCRDERSGRLRLALPGEPCALGVGWAEWEPAFRATRCVFVYDDAAGSELRSHFVGGEEEARRWVDAALGRREARPSPA
ncbi:MAG TPA: hypothetical protein VD838_21875 [Anaeromyxobacteraceae bacterium]|nr:hypothetical protein [Anaeromyxobacteraceae bacterium]